MHHCAPHMAALGFQEHEQKFTTGMDFRYKHKVHGEILLMVRKWCEVLHFATSFASSPGIYSSCWTVLQFA